MATKLCGFCTAETEEVQVTGLVLKYNMALCKSCDRVLRFATYPLAILVISILPLLYFQTAIPESIVIIWVVVGVVPFFVVVPIYLVVARLRNFTRQDVEMWVLFLAFTPFLGAVAVFLYQCYLWLRSGEWVAMPVTVLFEKVLHPDNALMRWFTSPESWLGFHKLVSGVSLSVGLVLLGVAVFFLYSMLEDHMIAKTREKASKQEKT